MPRLRPETRAARRGELVAAAWRCASRQGFRDMTLDDVCAEAGMTKGAFYAHFESKHALQVALIEDDAADVTDMMTALERVPLSAIERLRALTKALLERGSDPARMQVRADLWAAVLTETDVMTRVSRATQRHRWILRAWIEEAIAAGELEEVPANALASMLLALSDGLILHHALDPTGFKWSNVGKAVDALLSGITP